MPGLAEIETIIVDLPTIRPHVLAMATVHQQSIVLVRLCDEDGIVGVGEGTTIGGLSYCAESPETIKCVIDTYIAPVLKSCDLANIAGTMAALGRVVMGNPIAKSAVETALLDLAGRRASCPVSNLLGGGRLREALPVAWTLASGDTRQDIDEALAMIEARRHRIFKLKIGKRSVSDDVAHVAAIKRALGDAASLRVDVNQRWDETQADRGMAMLADAGVEIVEQPVARDARAAMARLSAKHVVPLMADEALAGPRDAFAIAAEAGARIFAIKIGSSGGLLAARDVAAIGEAAGIGLYGGTLLEGGVGTAASAQLFATLPTLAWGSELFGPLLLTHDVLAEPLSYADFNLLVPTGPGLGIEIDWDKVDHFRRDRQVPLLHAVKGGT
jgi:muconate cycloisomerase